MENTLSPAGAGGDEQTEAMAMTPLGKLLVVLVLLGGGFSAWKFGPTAMHAWSEPATSARTHAERSAAPLRAPAQSQAVPAAETPHATKPAQPSAEPSPDQAKRDRLMQVAVAGRAVAEQNRQRISELESTIQDLDDKLGALQARKSSSHAAREEAATALKAVHATVAAVKEAATVDIGALPVETVSARSIGITSLTKGAVSLAGGQQVTVGQALRTGETVVAVDPESHAIVTNHRIINVSN